MMRLMLFFLVCAFSISEANAVKEASALMEQCVDSDGKVVAYVVDPLFDRVAGLVFNGEGYPEIRTNPALLPRLLSESRWFLLANECARLRLINAGKHELSVAQVWQADCEALAILRRANMLKRNAQNSIAIDLHLSNAEWAHISGPRRKFDFAVCLNRPEFDLLTKTKIPKTVTRDKEWGACIHACSQPLIQCSTQACIQRYNDCIGTCDR